MITHEIFRKEDFTAVGKDVLIKVILKPEKGLVRNRLNNESNYVYGFVIEEKINTQILFLKPRSWDDRITHNIIGGASMETPDDSEFFVGYNDIEWIYVERWK